MADQSSGLLKITANAEAFRTANAAFFPAEAARAACEAMPGGFSGSPVGRVVLPSGACWVVKALPVSLDAQRGRRLHRFMRHLRDGSLACVPEAAELVAGGTLFRDASGRLWEMLRWMPGRPRLQPTAGEKAAAVAVVAAAHARAESFPEQPAAVAAAPSVCERAERIRQLKASAWRERLDRKGRVGLQFVETQREHATRIASALAAAADVLAMQGASALLRAGHDPPGPEQLIMVVRDLTADHLLFAEPGDQMDAAVPRVSGLIDFHAARRDTIACDLGRLLASWQGGLPSPADVRETVEEYRRQCVARGRMPPDATVLGRNVEWIAATAVVLGLDNWLRWIVEDQRQFPNWSAVADRVERHAAALPAALARLAELPVSCSGG